LSTPDSFFHGWFIKDGVAEGYVADLTKRLAILVGDETEVNNAFPRLGRVWQPAFRRTPLHKEEIICAVFMYETMKAHLVQVPAARGKVMPDMDSMREDFPALWEPMTAIIGKSMSFWTLYDNGHGHWTTTQTGGLPSAVQPVGQVK
jgi:hypothetical protein